MTAELSYSLLCIGRTYVLYHVFKWQSFIMHRGHFKRSIETFRSQLPKLIARFF